MAILASLNGIEFSLALNEVVVKAQSEVTFKNEGFVSMEMQDEDINIFGLPNDSTDVVNTQVVPSLVSEQLLLTSIVE